MSEPDFDLGMLPQYFAAAARHDKGDIYAQPKYVNLKLGFYVSYELVKLRAQAVQTATATKAAPKPVTRTTANTAVKVQMEIPGSNAKFTVPMKYVVQYADVPMMPVHPIGPPFAFETDGYLERAKSAKDCRGPLEVKTRSCTGIGGTCTSGPDCHAAIAGRA